MSHFTVLVVGPEPEKQLAPYHEFECTGADNEYVQDIDITSKVVAARRDEVFLDAAKVSRCTRETRAVMQERNPLLDVLEHFGLHETLIRITPRIGTDAEQIAAQLDLAGKHKFGYAVVNEDVTELVKVIDRTNPNKKWDWYQLGGRWTGFFQLLPGKEGTLGRPGLMTEAPEKGRADAALKQDIDIEAIRDEAEMKARKLYREFHRWCAGLPAPEAWTTVLGRFGEKELDAARTAYGAQPVIARLREHRSLFWIEEPRDFFLQSEEEQVLRARSSALVPFAFVKDGKWCERGEMGFWAMVSNETPRDEWEEQFSKMLDALPGDTLLSLYDCHI